jgi:hypothetical protein
LGIAKVTYLPIAHCMIRIWSSAWSARMNPRLTIPALAVVMLSGCSVPKRVDMPIERLDTANQQLSRANEQLAFMNQQIVMSQAIQKIRG